MRGDRAGKGQETGCACPDKGHRPRSDCPSAPGRTMPAGSDEASGDVHAAAAQPAQRECHQVRRRFVRGRLLRNRPLINEWRLW